VGERWKSGRGAGGEGDMSLAERCLPQPVMAPFREQRQLFKKEELDQP